MCIVKQLNTTPITQPQPNVHTEETRVLPKSAQYLYTYNPTPTQPNVPHGGDTRVLPKAAHYLYTYNPTLTQHGHIQLIWGFLQCIACIYQIDNSSINTNPQITPLTRHSKHQTTVSRKGHDFSNILLIVSIPFNHYYGRRPSSSSMHLAVAALGNNGS